MQSGVLAFQFEDGTVRMNMQTGMYIDGQWVTASRTIDVVSPVDSTVIASVSFGDASDAHRAVQAAEAALPKWRTVPASARADLLSTVASLIRSKRESLIQLAMLNSGKPRIEAEVDVTAAADAFTFYSELLYAEQEWDARTALPTDEFSGHVRYEPVGVAALIVPWNFPLVTSSWKLAPALAAGCTVVVKVSEITPLPELALAEILNEAGFFPGVANFIVGDGSEVGEALVTNPKVQKVSFTGSTAIGQRIMGLCARTIKRVSLELGGKSPIIVLADADLDFAVELIAAGIFYNAGQMCSATSRLLVDESVKEALLERLRLSSASIVPGSPYDSASTMGPLVTKKQYQRVSGMVDAAIRDGATLLLGGHRIGVESDGGNFYAPTILTDVARSSELWRTEVFGPVLAVMGFSSISEALELANDSDYGLAATVVGTDEQTLTYVTEHLQAGFVTVNAPQLVYPHLSWGGYKQSSLGRELGVFGLRAFQEVKSIVVSSTPDLSFSRIA
jgi:betaine-aldehyde dehydrogenase